MEGGSALPTSKAARQALLMDMMKLGFVSPDDGLKLMEIGGVSKLYETLKVDERQAQRENIRFRRLTEQEIAEHEAQFAPPPMPGAEMFGMPPMPGNVPDMSGGMPPGPENIGPEGEPLEPPPIIPVNTWDNHAVHIMTHDKFRKSQAFELMSEPVKQAIETHVQHHKAAMHQAMMEQMMMGGMPGMPGAPGMPGMPGEDPNAPPGQEPPGGNQFNGAEGMQL
jgi:hypothetical protein